MISLSNSLAQSSLSRWSDDDYHKNSHSQYKLFREVLAMYPFKGEETILDIGCGEGEVSQFIAREKVPHGSHLGIFRTIKYYFENIKDKLG
jgi:cyclopropane fatty-acyl-phospholipid synthase-like methyltransferase